MEPHVPSMRMWRQGCVPREQTRIVTFARVPHNVDTMMLHLTPKQKADGELTSFRNVVICRLD
jgi:hypothetical protein